MRGPLASAGGFVLHEVNIVFIRMHVIMSAGTVAYSKGGLHDLQGQCIFAREEVRAFK